MITPTEEVYNLKELALALGAPWQTVMAWKRNNQIPSASMTPDGKFIKSLIDPFIDWYKNSPTTDTPMRQEMGRQVSLPQNDSQNQNDPQTQNDSQGSDMAKKTKTKKVTYSPEVRQKAMRLLNEKKLSAYEVAKQLGCSNATVLSWQKKEQASTAPADPKAPEAVSAVAVNPSPKSEQQKLLPEPDFDTFVRNFWHEGTRAVDVLLLPPEIGPKVLNYVNEALKYAFETLR